MKGGKNLPRPSNHYELEFTSTEQLTDPILNIFKEQDIVKKPAHDCFTAIE